MYCRACMYQLYLLIHWSSAIEEGNAAGEEFLIVAHGCSVVFPNYNGNDNASDA